MLRRTLFILSLPFAALNAEAADMHAGEAEVGASRTVWLEPAETAPDDPSSRLRLDSWTTDDGLPLRAVDRVIQSANGKLWLATQEGLVQFDGYGFTVFEKSASALTSNSIYTIHEDGHRDLWIGTRNGGVWRLRDGEFQVLPVPSLEHETVSAVVGDGEGGLFLGLADSSLVHYQPGDSEARLTAVGAPQVKRITALVRDESGAIWIGTRGDGLFRYGQGVLTSFKATGALAHSVITDLSLAPDGSVWVSSREDGLARVQGYNIHSYGSEAGLPEDEVLSVLADPYGTVWFGTKDHGVWRLSGGLADQPAGLGELADRSVYDIYHDREGSVWLATSSGLDRLREARFHTFGVTEGLPTNQAYATLEARDGSIWVGTEKGLSRILRGEVDTDFPMNGAVDVISLAEDSDGRIWAGTYGDGLYVWEKGAVSHRSQENGTLPHDVIFALHAGQSGVWAATRFGAARLTATGYDLLDTEDGLASNDVTAIHEADNGDLWIGTYDAGVHLVRDGAVVARFVDSDFVMSILEDSRGDIWMGLREGGLVWLHDGTPTRFRTSDGLSSDNALAILEDDAGFLWISTNVGLSRISRHDLVNYEPGVSPLLAPNLYTADDGLRVSEFNGGTQPAAWKGHDGSLWFASAAGVVMVDPTRKNVTAPTVVIDRLVVPGKFDGIGDGLLSIEAGARRFEFEFTAASFVAPRKTHYMFKLEGYDRDWETLEAGHPRAAHYTNLSPGLYTFRVKARNADGVWSEQDARLELRLEPFYWQTAWFRFLLVAFALASLAYAYNRRIRLMTQRAEELEQMVNERTEDLRVSMEQTEQALVETEAARREAEAQRERAEESRLVIESQADKLREMDRIKTRFFNNISHEFRTPLTLNIGPMENALFGQYGEIPDALRRQIEVMLRNSRRLLRLINQLLDLSKLESGQMKLAVSEGSLSELVEGVVLSFTPFAEQKGLDLSLDVQCEMPEFLFDQQGLEKVFFNLLSNAVKFTPNDGKIGVTFGPGEMAVDNRRVPAVRVAVKDSGVGIPKAELQHIFDRFHQVDGQVSKVQEGTGIGLALVRELVELHGGTIRVTSEPGDGAQFEVTLPMDPALLGEHEIVEDDYPVSTGEPSPLMEMVVFDGDAEGTTQPRKAPSDAPVVLVVDDSPDVRQYVVECLSGTYAVETAKDGAHGLEMARLVHPDLIVSDVMMPRMTGFDMTRALKEDPALSHIPVVLVTSKASPEDKIEGLEAGAEDYVAKPFSSRELLARVGNLIRVRQQKGDLEVLNSELLSSNAALRQASEMKSQLLSIASHDMKNPLTAIREFARILREDNQETSQLELLNMIFDSSNDMLGLISQLLDSVELEGSALNVDKERTDLVDLVERVVERNAHIADRKSQVIHTRLGDPASCTAAVDGERIREAMDNYISNAVKYSPMGGGIFVGMERSRNEVVFSVRDEGPGLTGDDLDRVFGKFQRLSARPTGGETSTGLGLSIVKQIIELHGGRVWVDSSSGKGATFNFSVPAEPREESAKRDRPASERSRRVAPGTGRGTASSS